MAIFFCQPTNHRYQALFSFYFGDLIFNLAIKIDVHSSIVTLVLLHLMLICFTFNVNLTSSVWEDLHFILRSIYYVRISKYYSDILMFFKVNLDFTVLLQFSVTPTIISSSFRFCEGLRGEKIFEEDRSSLIEGAKVLFQ